MTSQAYGQYCGLARAIEVVGEPWALLVVRDLLVAPKRLTDLREGLPLIPTSVLSKRLEELEYAGVVRRRAPSRPALSVVYELTEYGAELEEIVLRLGRWGARILGGPRREEIVTSDSMVMALRTTFRPDAARGLRVSYVLHLGELVIHARVDDGTLEVGEGPLADPDLVLEAGPALKALMAGEMSPREAIESGGVRLTGDPGLLAWFVECFHIAPAPIVRPNGNGHPVNSQAAHQRRTGHAMAVGAEG